MMTATTELIAELRRMHDASPKWEGQSDTILSRAADALESAVQQPNRAQIVAAIADRLSWPSIHWDWRTPAAHAAIADAILAALPIPATGEVEWEYSVTFSTAAPIVVAPERVYDSEAELIDDWGVVSGGGRIVRRVAAGQWVEVTP